MFFCFRPKHSTARFCCVCKTNRLLISLLCTVSALCADSVVENKATSTILRAPFELIALPYSYNALEPVIGYETMALHHGKHLKGYVDKLNKLVMGTPYEMMTLEEIVVMADSSVFDEVIFDNAGQLLNHNLYFMQFVPATPGEPQGLLLDAIIEQWGSYDKFKNLYAKHSTSLGRDGCGWLPIMRVICTSCKNTMAVIL